MKTILLSYFFIFLNSNIQAQDVCLKIYDIKYNKKSQEFDIFLEVYTKEKDWVRIYKPQLEDICSSLVSVKFISETRDLKTFVVFPCEDIIDLESVIITVRNSVFLSNGEYLGTILSFNCEAITLGFVEDTYEVQVEFNYSTTNYEGEIGDLFKGDLLSNKFSYETKIK